MSDTARRPHRPGPLGWAGAVCTGMGVAAAYLGFATLTWTATAVAVLLVAVAAGVLALSVVAQPGPVRGAAVRATLTWAAYVAALFGWRVPVVGPDFALGGAVVAAVLVVAVAVVRRRPGAAGAVLAGGVLVGLALAAGVALRALALGEPGAGAALVVAGCAAAVAYVAVTPAIGRPRDPA
ncbi:hypothetical protein LWC35_07985 [Pseudonocardia kujensis]|uniref:hypothetical protein n=1 Tax=Pseudonocardia kujensis TaxID=1128675 RepID=UPI001E5248A0|nr:hypothetical protein [Pseudonocardia kujensis]MCE0762851.1 hypothetical protein [Pseudonocardia kujensis]